MKGKKIVIDTNIFIGALIGREGSTSRELLKQCFQSKYQPLMGNALFNEYLDVMNREEIKFKCPLSDREATDLSIDFMSICQWVKIFYLWRPNLTDEADNHLIELAIAGNARIIATKNVKDFARSQLLFPQIGIFKPEELI
jgi:putative PIN family toxin of toxin-antitoxin system